MTYWTWASVYLPGNAVWSLHPRGAVPKSGALLAQARVSKFCLRQAYLPPSLCDGPLGSQALPGSDWGALLAFPPSSPSSHSALGPSSLRGPSSFLPAPPIPPLGAASWEPQPGLPLHSLPFPLASPCLVPLLSAALWSVARGRCPGIGRAVAGMTRDMCCSVSASPWSLLPPGRVRREGSPAHTVLLRPPPAIRGG